MRTGLRFLGSVPGDLQDKSLFRQQAFVDGKWVDAKSGRKIEVLKRGDASFETCSSHRSLQVRNPATGKVLGTVPDMTGAETRTAIEVHSACFKRLA